jgi:hypothetical protein
MPNYSAATDAGCAPGSLARKKEFTMKRRVRAAFRSSVLGTGLLLLCSLTLLAQDNSSSVPTVRHATAFRVSESLRDLAKLPPAPQYVLPAHLLVRPSQRPPVGAVVDAVEQSAASGRQNFSIGVNGGGLGSGFSGFNTLFDYPDDNIAVSKDQIVQWVNNSYMVFDKSLNPLLSSPVSFSTLWAGEMGNCSTENPTGHPIAQYDRIGGHWLLAENVVSTQPFNGTACIAVSQTGDATGKYYLYEYSLGDGYPDLPKWGLMPSGFFQSNDNFGSDGRTFQGPHECAYDGATMEMGGKAVQECFPLSKNDFALLPADLDSAPPPPPPLQDEFLFSLWDSSNLALYSFHTDFINPSNAFITGNNGSQLFPVTPFTLACNGQGLGACVPQLGTNVQLDVLGDRLLYRVAYYNDVPVSVPVNAVPPHYQHWLVMHDVTTSGGSIGERWYEFYSSTKTTPVTGIRLLQSGTYAPDNTNYRWMGSMARDQIGDILMGYSESSTEIYPSIYITGRTLKDPLGTMEDELQVTAGQGAYLGMFDHDLHRWGDYTSMRLDPADNCTFWYTNEWYMSSGILNWSTQINSAQFTGCAAPK